MYLVGSLENKIGYFWRNFKEVQFFYLTLCHPFLMGLTHMGYSGKGVVKTYFSLRCALENLNYNSVGPNKTFGRWPLLCWGVPRPTFWSRKVGCATFSNIKIPEKDKISTTTKVSATIFWVVSHPSMIFNPPQSRKSGRQWSGINPTDKRRKMLLNFEHMCRGHPKLLFNLETPTRRVTS